MQDKCIQYRDVLAETTSCAGSNVAFGGMGMAAHLVARAALPPSPAPAAASTPAPQQTQAKKTQAEKTQHFIHFSSGRLMPADRRALCDVCADNGCTWLRG